MLSSELILFLVAIFLFTLLFGKLLEDMMVPWVFAPLILGLLFAFKNPFASASESETFKFLAELGMYFFLFVIGFEIDLEQIKKKGSFIVKSAAFIIMLEGFLGTFFLHYLFGTPWLVSGIVALSFATVGEAVLLPILDEFGIIDTDLGQTIIGIGVVDDIFEIITVITATVLVGMSTGHSHLHITTAIFSLAALFGLTYLSVKLERETKKFSFSETGMEDGALFLFVIFVILAFIYLGQYAEASAIGALFAGIGVKNFFSEERAKSMEREIKAVTYGFFGPLFFLWVGLDVSFSIPSDIPLSTLGFSPITGFLILVALQIILVKFAKILGSIVVGRNVLGIKKSIIMGISLSVKFSTSIVIIKMLFEQGLIGSALYSVLIFSKIIFKFIVPFLLSFLFTRWNIR